MLSLRTLFIFAVHNDEIYVPGTTDHADAVEQCEIGKYYF